MRLSYSCFNVTVILSVILYFNGERQRDIHPYLSNHNVKLTLYGDHLGGHIRLGGHLRRYIEISKYIYFLM